MKHRFDRDDMITRIYQGLAYLSLALIMLFGLLGIWLNSNECGLTSLLMIFPFVIFGMVAVIRS